jgi:trimeric autotransporter adhesin
LLSFSGYTEGGVNKLVWTTANELNNKGFQIERASPQSPTAALMTWESIGFVNAKGKDSRYDFTDTAPPTGAGVTYYRLRQIDNDGKETLSKTISLSNTAKSLMKVYPNPTSEGEITVEIGSDTDGTSRGNREGGVFMINALGQVVFQQKTTPNAMLKVDISTWSSGIYFVKSGKEMVKFVKN